MPLKLERGPVENTEPKKVPTKAAARVTDSRQLPVSRATVAMTNDSRVFQAIRGEGRPLTVSEIHAAVPNLSDKTIRRCVKSLVRNGLIQEAGKKDNSFLYATLNADPTAGNAGRMIPIGKDTLLSVEDFVRLFASPEMNPLASDLKIPILTDEIQNFIRTRMLLPVVLSGMPGYEGQLKTTHANLLKIQGELQHVVAMLDSFNNSAVWYETYRDRIAFAMRRLQEKDPELFALTMDFIKS